MPGTPCKIAMTDVMLPPLPAQALRARLGPHPENVPWAAYLPAALKPGIQKQYPGVFTPSLQRGSVDQKTALAERSVNDDAGLHTLPSLMGRVWPLSRDPHGCRVVQRALDVVDASRTEAINSDTCTELLDQIVHELQGHILEASRCPHANHVLQKLILTIDVESTQFIIHELMPKSETLVQVARHKYGCRIIQRLLERCLPFQMQKLMEVLLVDAITTCNNSYGNYVMQHVLKYGTDSHRANLLQQIEGSVADLCRDDHGCAVINAAMSCLQIEQQQSLAKAVATSPGLLQFMARARTGHLAAKLVYEALPPGDDQEAARRCLVAETVQLRSSRFGTSLAETLGLPAEDTQVSLSHGRIKSS